MLALLASDVSDIPPGLLERTIKEHARQSPYMPKASELIRIAKTFVDPPQRSDVRSLLQRLNDQNTRQDAHWVAGEDGTPHMEWRR